MTTIRPAHWTDHAQLVPLVEAFSSFHHALDPVFRPRWIGFTAAILQTWLDEPDDIHLVAESEGRIAGYVWASVSTGNTGNYTFLRRNLFVNVLAVDEMQRRRGIGRELFNAVEIAARDYDAEVIQLNVLKQNEAAITFYRSLGYETMSVNMTKTLRSVTRIEGL